MAANLVQAYLVICILGVASLRRIPAMQVAIAIFLLFVLAFTYVSVPASVAQDRYNYFLWYLNASNTSFELIDPGFNFIMKALPEGLDLQQFSLMYALIFFAFVLVFYLVALKRLGIEYAAIGLFLAFLVLDRYFLTLSFNTTRSSLAGVVFCFVFLSNYWPTRIIFILTAFSVHYANTAILLIVFLGAYFFRFTNLLKYVTLVLGLAFVIKFLSDFRLFDLTLLESILYRWQDTRFERGLEASSDETTTSLFIQFALALVLPVFVVALSARDGQGGSERTGLANLFAKDARNDRKTVTTRFVLMSACAFFLTYPEILLAQRILIASLLLLPFGLDRKSVLSILFIKSAIFIFYVFPRILNGA